ncbi:hypothetical protein [Bacillus anthracis]|nr:hypothetical protein [Bacillus anthracis]
MPESRARTMRSNECGRYTKNGTKHKTRIRWAQRLNGAVRNKPYR